MVDDGHENGRVRAFAKASFKHGQVAKVFAVPAFSVVCDFQCVVRVFGNDFDIVTDAEIAL